MMVKKSLVAICLLVSTMLAFTQNEAPAKEVMDRVSDKMKSLSTFKISFTYTYEDVKTEDSFSEEGSIVIKGDMYKVDMRNTEIYFNGSTMWTYLESIEEVNVMDMSTDEQEEQGIDFSNPRNIFILYDKDFKVNYVDKVDYKGVSCHKIDLYPKNLKTSYSRVRVLVDEKADLFKFIKVFAKDGTHYTFDVSEIKTHLEVSAGFFSFQKEDHPDVRVIDMR